MRLSWNEIRIRAAAFAREWAGEGYEKGQTQLFYKDLFDVFGVPVRRVASFEEPVRRLGDQRGYIDLFWKGVLLVEQKSMGRTLVPAKQQALEYFPGLTDSELPRYILLSDFQTFELYDLDEDLSWAFTLAELPDNVTRLGFIIGVQPRSFRDQDPVNIAAAELVGSIHDALESSGYTGHDLEQFLVRLTFCLFSDDTGIFEPRDIFLDLLETRTREDGSDLGGWLSQLFQTLDTPEDKRPQTLDEDLARFPYINGDLFSGPLRIPSFNADIRARLIDACSFDWSGISPAIFGSLFQSVMEPAERRAQGAHYTTELNIKKVIGPLFLDSLVDEFKRLRTRRTGKKAALLSFQEKLGSLRFLDPACGCGNFLVITYRELRRLEMAVIEELRLVVMDAPKGRTMTYQDQLEALDVADLSRIDVNQFYGIEINEFPVRIAETALWMMDHIMNTRLSLQFGQSYVRIPIQRSPRIVCADALEIDWKSVLPASECSYVLGNPPFVGSKYQSDEQRDQVQRIANLGGSGGTLDYVAAWFIRAGEYVERRPIGIGFVATNSITQGEQVAQLWPTLFERSTLEIVFAHRTFPWGSDAAGMAHVHVVIIGLIAREHAGTKRRLFSYQGDSDQAQESIHGVLSPYLFDATALRDPHLVVRSAGSPLNGFPRLRIGSKPIDGGHYIFEGAAKEAFLLQEPGARQFFHPYIGAREFINGGDRWILWLGQAPPEALARLPLIRERIEAVGNYRRQSTSEQTRDLALTPTLYHVNVIPSEPFMVIPETGSERREYVPIGWLEPPVIPSNLVRIIEGGGVGLFGLLSSAMHMAWMRKIGGRLKSDPRYSIDLVYHTFPPPPGGLASLEGIEPAALAVLEARAQFPRANLAELYDPDTMPPALRRAHRALDRKVDRLYKGATFGSESERVEHLLALYEGMVTPLTVPRRSKRVRGHR